MTLQGVDNLEIESTPENNTGAVNTVLIVEACGSLAARALL